MLDARKEAHVNNFMYNRLKRSDLVDTKDIRTRAHDTPLFKISIPKVQAYKRAVKYAGALQWNSLPRKHCGIGSFVEFKAKQKLIMCKTTG